MGRVVHFELPADDLARAVSFYSQIFGWKMDRVPGPEEYWLATTGEGQPGINGGIARRQGPVSLPSLAVDVASVDDFARRIEAAGGKVITPKMPIPEVGYVAYFRDTEGNVLSVFQADESAK